MAKINGLSNQIKRAAVSIPSCIAEGHDRSSKPQFRYFLSMAQGSRAEVETQIRIAERLHFINKEQVKEILDLCEIIGKMLYNLSKSLGERSTS